MDGDWTTPDLVPLVRLMLRNRRVLDGQSRLTGALRRLAGGVARRLRDNSLAGSRRHIRRHYDLGNDFFRLFLDAELLMYSCGYFESAADALEQAQAQQGRSHLPGAETRRPPITCSRLAAGGAASPSGRRPTMAAA